MAILNLTLPIKAKPTPRGRKSGRSIKQHIYNTAEYKAYKQMLQAMLIVQLEENTKINCIQHLVMTFTGATRGDADNFMKAIKDALKEVGLVVDDNISRINGTTSIFIKGNKPIVLLNIIYDDNRPYYTLAKLIESFDSTLEN